MKPWLYGGCLLLLISLISGGCRQPHKWVTTGEYSHGLRLCTKENGNFQAWFAPDSVLPTAPNIMFSCMPHTPQANVVAFVAPNTVAATFGVLTHLGTDSFRLTFDSLPHAPHRFEQVFALVRPHPEWQHFYFWVHPDSALLYTAPNYRSPRRACPVGAHLYSTDSRAEWVNVATDSAVYWVRRKDVF